jgi:hypothetical protein
LFVVIVDEAKKDSGELEKTDRAYVIVRSEGQNDRETLPLMKY